MDSAASESMATIFKSNTERSFGMSFSTSSVRYLVKAE